MWKKSALPPVPSDIGGDIYKTVGNIKKSNGLSEWLNNRIKVIKRVAFGLQSFDSLRTRVLLTCGKLRLSKDPLSILENGKVGKELRL